MKHDYFGLRSQASCGFLNHHIFYTKRVDLINLSKLLHEKYKTLGIPFRHFIVDVEINLH
jgi:hypothetical protein